MDLYVKLAVLGLVAGAISSGTAIGWGLITAPMLLLALQFPPKEGVALSVMGGLGYLLALGFYRHLSGGIPLGGHAGVDSGQPRGWGGRCDDDRSATGHGDEADYRRDDDYRWCGAAYLLGGLSPSASSLVG
jgi:hypothetical protein